MLQTYLIVTDAGGNGTGVWTVRRPNRYIIRAMTEIATIRYLEGESRIRLTERGDVFPRDADLSVFDGNTAPLFADRDPERSLVLPPGEVAKSWASVERVINRALAVSVGRDGLFTGVGGGVVTDVTAFAASLYMRGCRLVLVPTTLLGMVDAACGGKTGIDFGGVKNLVGTFYPAEEVRICPELLESLPENEFISGMAEVVKHALLAAPSDSDDGIWSIAEKEREAIMRKEPEVLARLITAAIQVKADIVSDDLRESSRRAFLNLGHTFAHALEAATNFSRWTHGEAVGWGMLRALELGERIGITDSSWAGEARRLISDYGFAAVKPQVPPAEIKTAMMDDKKKRDGRLRFVLMRGGGNPVLQEVPEEDLNAVLGIR